MAHTGVEDIKRLNEYRGNQAPVTAGMSPEQSRIESITEGARSATVHWGDGYTSEFHYVWLRHSCFCPVCGDSGDGIRSVTVLNVDKDVRPASIQISDDGRLEIVWDNDGHQSSYHGSWLRAYCYSDTERARRQRFQPTIWRADIINNFPTVDYRTASHDQSERLRMLELLRDYGIVKLLDVGDAPEETECLAKLVGPIHETTVYGYIYDVQAEPVSKLGAKTAMHQDPHHDDTFYYSPPGIDVFHCLVNTTEGGGESTYVDGFAVAEAIRVEAPEAFEPLRVLIEIMCSTSKARHGAL